MSVLVDAAGQATYRDDLAGDGVETVSAALATGLTAVAERGSLFKLSAFGDAVLMNPEVNVGLPTLEGTRLETSFVAKLVGLSSVRQVAELYKLEFALVERGVAFEREAA